MIDLPPDRAHDESPVDQETEPSPDPHPHDPRSLTPAGEPGDETQTEIKFETESVELGRGAEDNVIELIDQDASQPSADGEREEPAPASPPPSEPSQPAFDTEEVEEGDIGPSTDE